ncbi:MAG TPA: type II secretion system F family protein, partial [Verrucomicrobiae bacterium]|nr:type II secretion system F family protein [Verrucomicrobiae bacterium]
MQADGAMAEGQLEAAGRQEAFRQMEGKGLRPVSLSERAGSGARRPGLLPASMPGLSLGKKAGKVSARALENFTRLLSSLLSAGVPLSRALVILHKEASSPAAGSKWKEIHDFVVDGMSLADAMSKSPGTFPRVYVAMVQAGETGGFLDLVLAQIADFQSREKELKSKVMTAMLYPCILLILAIGVLIFLLTFFIPRFQSIFAGFNAALPLPTQMVLAASHAIRSYGFFVLAG